jgi:hypothetical protein
MARICPKSIALGEIGIRIKEGTAPGLARGGTLMATSESRAGERPMRNKKPSGPRQPASSEEAAAPSQTQAILELAGDLLKYPDLWLRASNPQLGNRRPIDLIGTEEEFRVYNLLNAVNWGLF